MCRVNTRNHYHIIILIIKRVNWDQTYWEQNGIIERPVICLFTFPVFFFLFFSHNQSGPVHHCSQYGVLAVPKNINFNATFDLATAEHECKELGFTLPIRTAPGVETCVKDFQNRMMELFQMKLRPLIWWQGDIGGYRHLVCLARKFLSSLCIVNTYQGL